MHRLSRKGLIMSLSYSNEFSKAFNALQQVVDDVNRVFDAVSQELYRIYKECDGAEIRERIEDLMNRLRKIVSEAGSRS